MVEQPESEDPLLPLSEVERRFDAWVVETFENVPGLTTELFNRFRAAADRFKALLKEG